LIFRGRIWKFGDDVNTDLIIPGRYLDKYDPKHLAAHAMEGANKDFASKVGPGDVILGGKNFGCGSSREQAVIAIKHAGVSAVVARSFSRIFYRNAINLGLPVVISADAHTVFDEGDYVVLDLEVCTIATCDRSKRAAVEAIPDHLQRILLSGGLVPHLRSKILDEGGS